MNFWRCYMWYQRKFPNTSLEYWLNLHTKQENKNTDHVLNLFLYRNINCIMQKMEGVEASAENGSHHNNPYNIYVELNNQPSELIETVKELKDELPTVKVDNEIILELNHILLDKIHNRGKDKRNVYVTYSETVSYKHKGKKLKFMIANLLQELK